MGDLILPVVLQAGAVAVIIAEIFLPSAGVLTAIALGMLGYSLFLVFTQVGQTVGALFVALDVILLPVAVIVGLKLISRSPASLRTSLSTAGGVSSQSPDLEKYLGAEGAAHTDLRPSGIAMLNGRRVDVTTRGEYIERHSRVYVSAVRGNQIIVRKQEENA